MPANGFTIGRDVSLSINGPDGPVNFSLITNFSAKKENINRTVKGFDGIPRNFSIPNGFSGGFDVTRDGPSVDSYFAQKDSDYYAGQNEQVATITEIIQNGDGSVSTFRYTGVILYQDNVGDYSPDAEVKQHVGFMASQRLEV